MVVSGLAPLTIPARSFTCAGLTRTVVPVAARSGGQLKGAQATGPPSGDDPPSPSGFPPPSGSAPESGFPPLTSVLERLPGQPARKSTAASREIATHRERSRSALN